MYYTSNISGMSFNEASANPLTMMAVGGKNFWQCLATKYQNNSIRQFPVVENLSKF